MAKRWPAKDADEAADFGVDWSARLAGDSVTSSSWTVPAGLIAGQDHHTPTLTVVWLAGGVEHASYSITNTITTAGLRRYKQSVRLRIKSK